MKFRKKPVVIEATQWFKDGDHPAVVRKVNQNRYSDEGVPWIPTLEGGHVVTPGDWIITGIKGENYPCKPDIFAATYEAADAEPAPPAAKAVEMLEFDRDTDGELLIDWSPSQGRMLTLSLRDDGRLSYAVMWDGENFHGQAQMPAREVEAVQAQPASVVGKIVECDYVRDMVGVKVAPGIAESLPICAQVTISAAQPASAPMGEPSEYKRGMTLRECIEAEERPVACQHCEGWKRLAEIALEGAAMDKRIKEIREQYGLDASPAQARMPLSDKQIDELWLFRIDLHDGEILRQVRDFARAIESAHGISGESSGAARKDGVDQPATPSLSRGNAMRLLSLYATALKDDNEEMREQWAEEIIARLSGTHGVPEGLKR